MNEALVTPSMLRWARERLGLSPEEAAEKVKVRPHKLLAWENDQARPSFLQAEKLANALRVPIGYFYLDIPPDERATLPDLRTLADVLPRTLSPDLLDVLNDALRKQEWYRDHLTDEGAPALEFVGRFSLSDSADTVASNLRRELAMDISVSEGSKDWDAYLTALVQRAESAGVTVLRSGVVGSNSFRKLNVAEFRGFALVDRLAPFVFINGQDSVAARVFTLIHELAHIWIGQEGISNQDPEYVTPSRRRIEKHCNSVAAETLVPSSELQARWTPGKGIDVQVGRLARSFRVSRMVVLRRAFELERVTREEFHEQAKVYAANLGKISKTSGGGAFYPTLAARSGKHFLAAVISSALEGRTLYREAAGLLSVTVPVLRTTAERLGLE